jgi:hypothetical protein
VLVVGDHHDGRAGLVQLAPIVADAEAGFGGVLNAFDTGHAADTGYIFGEPGPAALVTADVIAPLGSWSPKG